MPEAAVAEALQAVARAVGELHEANFNTVEDLQAAKEKLAAALQAARNAGASAAELLQISKPKTVEVDDASSTGSAARKARKLRQLEKELQKREQLLEEERLDAERTERVAQAAAARRLAKAKNRAQSKSPLEKEHSQESPVSAREDQTVPNEMISELVVHSRPGPGRVSGRRASPLRFRGGASRSRSGERSSSAHCGRDGVDAGETYVQAEPEAQHSLASLLGRPTTTQPGPPGSALHKPKPVDLAHMPLSMLTASAPIGAGVRRLGSSDLSTGGGEICHNFSVGKCSRWGCKFKHVPRN